MVTGPASTPMAGFDAFAEFWRQIMSADDKSPRQLACWHHRNFYGWCFDLHYPNASRPVVR